MTRDQMIERERLTPRTCRGKFDRAIVKRSLGTIARLEHPGVNAEPEVLAAHKEKYDACLKRLGVPSRCVFVLDSLAPAAEDPEVDFHAKVVETKVALLADGDTDRARWLDNALRKPCGWNLTEWIVEQEFDGAEFEVDCPDCGLRHTGRLPYVDGVEE